MSERQSIWNDCLDVASLSDVGMRRTNNQDSLTVSLATSMEHWQRKGHVFVVADGMGAHAAGELASKLAVDHVPHLYAKFNDASAPEELRKAVTGANAEIHRRGMANEEFFNMGTTCSTLALLPQGAVVAHIGDSRVYRLSNNRLEQLTFDHSLVWEMKAAGQLSPEDEKSGKIPSNVITRSLGPYAECKVDLEGPFPLKVNDTFLMCSDGLTAVITDLEIGSILANMSPTEAVRVMVDLANLRGGPDNITVIVAKVTAPKLATSDSAKPLVVNSRRATQNIHPMVWAIFGGSAFFTLLFYWFMSPATAALPGVVAIGSFLYLATKVISALGSGDVVTTSKRFGKGPYVRVGCASGQQFAKQLAGIWQQLVNGAQQQQWPVNESELKRLTAQAESANSKNDFAGSIRAYGKAISFMMEELRNHADSSSSSIEL